MRKRRLVAAATAATRAKGLDRRTHLGPRSAIGRATAVGAIAAGVVLAGGAGADAGEPAVHACVGKSLSALATDQPAPGAFGQGVRGFAQDPSLPPPGLGDGIRALAAGAVPDTLVANTCNVDG